MSARPSLVVVVDDQPVVELVAPEELGARAWILGVVAVQLTIDERGQVVAQLRAQVTGAAKPLVRALPSPSVVQVTLRSPAAQSQSQSQSRSPPLAAGDAAQLALFLDGSLVDVATLAKTLQNAAPAPRGFGHVFCRWLRDGGNEPGFDLTDFVSLAPGRKFERRVHRALAPGETVSYFFERAGSADAEGRSR